MITVILPFDSPPLRSNQRLHWAPKAELTRQVRAAAMLMTRGNPPIAGPVTVTLVWTVCDKRRRDVGAASPTLKAGLDGLVDAGLISRDDHEVVVEERCRIEMGPVPGVRIEIEPAP